MHADELDYVSDLQVSFRAIVGASRSRRQDRRPHEDLRVVVRESSRVEEDLARELKETGELVSPSRRVHVLVFELRPHEASVLAEKLGAVIVWELDRLSVPTDGDHFRAFR